jgi:hypothetical protein
VAYWSAFGGALFASGAGFLIAAAQTSRAGWADFFVAAGVTVIACSLYIFAALGLDRGLPVVGPERTRKKHEQLIEAIQADAARRDAFEEVLDELSGNRRNLVIELENKRVYGGYHNSTAWRKNIHLLSGPEAAERREIVDEAHRLTLELNDRNRERFEAASHDEVNDPAWQALTDEEREQRETAVGAVTNAWLAVVDVQLEEAERKQTRGWRRVWR